MFLFGTIGTYVQINLVLLTSIIIFGVHMYFVLRYILCIMYDQNIKAEKYIAFSGYFGVLAMVVQFILGTIALENSKVELEHSYYGMLLALLALVIIPILVLSDNKQRRWIKSLSLEDQKKYNISLKDRLPLIGIISGLVIISLALFGFVIEGYIYIVQAL